MYVLVECKVCQTYGANFISFYFPVKNSNKLYHGSYDNANLNRWSQHFPLQIKVSWYTRQMIFWHLI